jgi:hypothetical protein
MNIDTLNQLVSEIETNYKQYEKVYIENDAGDPVIRTWLPEYDRHIATIYPIDAMHPREFMNVTSVPENYVNDRPIVIYAKGSTAYDFSIPTSFQAAAPYTGRPFIHQKWDCFTLLKDFYKREFNIDMPPVEYYDEWWNKGDDFYMKTSGAAGFYPVVNLQKYDVIAMRLNSHVFNHSAIYLGDNKILHHVGGKFSCIEEIRPAYMRMIFGYFRHKDLVLNG